MLVASAGNDGEWTDCVGYSAKYSTVMAISAMDPRDDTLASFSSTGPEVELTAPGVDTLSTIPPESDDGSTYANGYETFSGTSMSAPRRRRRRTGRRQQQPLERGRPPAAERLR